MNRESPVRFLIFLAGFSILVFFSVFTLTRLIGKHDSQAISLAGGDKIGVLEIKGVIVNSRKTLDNLRQFMQDRSIKGILLRIDSPGGAVAPSQEIYSELWKIREKGEKKIVASFGNVAASGGYYIASASDRIVSNPGTITGSIGVIMEMSNIQKLLEKIGVEPYVIKSGEFKDIGSTTRPMSEREKKILQGVIDDVYMQFVEDVAKGRGLTVEKVKKIANGTIFSGRQALGLGLVDQLGTFQDAVNLLAKLSGIQGKPKLIYEKKEKPSWMSYLVKGIVREISRVGIRNYGAGIMYLMH